MDQGTQLKTVPFILATGFLGSGKTTLVKRFLTQFADERKIVVIQNEFAETSVDGHELKETGKSFEIVEINKGSVFCVCLIPDFIGALADVLSSCRPEVIVLEATGLADPIAVAQLLAAPQIGNRLFLSHVWSVVDVTTFLEMSPQVQRMIHQVRVADTIILNKTDGVAEERIAETSDVLSRLNPHADQIRAAYCSIPSEALEAAMTAYEGKNRRPPQQTLLPSGRPASIHSAVLRSTRHISAVNLDRFLRDFRDRAYRIKGYANLDDRSVVSVQVCFEDIQVAVLEKEPGPTELIALGPGVDQEAFSGRFMELSSL